MTILLLATLAGVAGVGIALSSDPIEKESEK
jgi:hypothetical protein